MWRLILIYHGYDAKVFLVTQKIVRLVVLLISDINMY